MNTALANVIYNSSQIAPDNTKSIESNLVRANAFTLTTEMPITT
jgi:hypothetical protein